MEVKKVSMECFDSCGKVFCCGQKTFHREQLRFLRSCRKLILMLFIIGSLCESRAQWIEINATCAAVTGGYSLYYQIQDRNAFKHGLPEENLYSEKWHKLQSVELLNYILVGVQIGIQENNGPALIVTNIVETAAIRWIVRDGIYQAKLGNSFWNLSKETTAQFEQLGSPFVKLGFLICIIIFKYLILPEL